MNTEKYLLLHPTRRHIPNYYKPIAAIKVQLITGFSGDNIQNVFNVQETWTPLGNSKDKLYFLPGCNVPRFKVREHFTNTIKPENATAVFVSRNNLQSTSDNSLIHHSELYKCSYDETVNIINNMVDLKAKALIEDLIKNNHIKDIFLSKSFWKDDCYDLGYFYDRDIGIGYGLYHYMGTGKYSHKKVAKEPQYQLYSIKNNSVLSKIKCDVYFEDEVLKHLNQNNLILTEEKYQELRSFGLTNDQENIILMMELMSNCNFEKSIVYLMLLLQEFYNYIAPLKESNHVNFKSLLRFLKLNDIEDIHKLDLIMMKDLLINYNVYTKHNSLRITLPYEQSSVIY